uniref:Uncharacterized protein n=1 Tax=Rhizophora mucronata TaxID=61149 RepID=A0A2P2Q2K5_RHIMU
MVKSTQEFQLKTQQYCNHVKQCSAHSKLW